MRKFKQILLLLLGAATLAACGGGGDEKSTTPLPEFEELTFTTSSRSSYNINIVYQHIANTEASDTYAAIETSNMELTFPHDEYGVAPNADFEERAAALVRDIEEDGFEVFELDLVQTAFLTRDNTVLCYANSRYAYAGGAHGISSLYYVCYDLASGQMYDFGYLNEGEWDESLRKLIHAKLYEIYDATELSVAPDQLYIPDSVLITDVGLLLVYQPYEIGPYSLGQVSVELTDEDIAATGAPMLWVEQNEVAKQDE